MSDYEPYFVYMIPVAYKKKEVFFENIEKTPARIRGAYLIDEQSEEEIEFTIYGPDNGIIVHWTGTHHIFDFNVTQTGSYKIILNNKYTNSDVRVTFTMNTAQNEILKKGDLSKTSELQEDLYKQFKSVSLSMKMSHEKHSNRFKSEFDFIYIMLFDN